MLKSNDNPFTVSSRIKNKIESVDVHIDAITMVANIKTQMKEMYQGFERYRKEAEKEGFKMSHFRRHRYSGWLISSVFFGMDGEDSYMIGSTGEASRALAHWLQEVTGTVTRMDIALTVGVLVPDIEYALDLYTVLPAASTKSMVRSSTGDTLYLGRRGGTTYLRIYDKSNSYGEGLGTSWRFEVELGRGQSEKCWEEYVKATDKIALMSTWLNASFSRKHVTIPLETEAYVPFADRGYQYKLSSREKHLKWIRTFVQPSVRFLVAIGEGEEVAEALGLQSRLPGFE